MNASRNDDLTDAGSTDRLSRRFALRRLGQGGLAATAASVLGADAALAGDSSNSSGGAQAGGTDLAVPSSTRGALPAAEHPSSGQLRRLTDYDRNLWLETDGQWMSLSGEVFDVRAFGAIGDGTTDDWPAFSGAIEAMTTALDADSTSAYGRTLYVPPGTYRLAQTLVIDRAIRLVGASGIGPNTDSILQVDAGIIGILIAAVDPALTGDPGRRGDGTIVERLRIVSSPPPDGARTPSRSAKSVTAEADPNVIHGIWVQARASLRDTCVEQFSGDGIRIEIAGTDNTIPVANWDVHNCWVAACGNHGLAVAGMGSGTARLVNATKNGKWGVIEGSTGGSTFLQCHAADNGSGAFSSSNAQSRSLFIECIADAGQPRSAFANNTIVVGGAFAGGYGGGNAWTADASRMLLQAQPPGTGETAVPTAPTLHISGAEGQVRAHLRISTPSGARVAEVDSAGHLLVGPAGLLPTSAGAPPVQVQISHPESGQSGVRWAVGGGANPGGWVAQARAYRGGAATDANPQGGANRLTFQTAATDGGELDTLTLSRGWVGIGTTSPAALLDLTSTSQGFLPPRLTSEQRDGIPAPPEGLTIYNTTTKRLNFHDGDNWREVAVS